MPLGREGQAGPEDRSQDKEVSRGQVMKGIHKVQVKVFSACFHVNGKPLNTIFGGGKVQAVGSDMIRFAFCKDHLQNCVNQNAMKQEWKTT